MIIDWYRNAQSIVGSAIPGLVVLGSVKKHDKSEVQTSDSTHPYGLCVSSCIRVPALDSVIDCDGDMLANINSFFPKLPWFRVFYHSTRS